MRKETCAICGEIVYVEEGEEFEWVKGSILCEKYNKFYCADHKPCCATNIGEQACDGIEDDDIEEADPGDEEDDIEEDDIEEDDMSELETGDILWDAED